MGTLSDLDADLRLLWSRLGELDGARPGWSASHFSANQIVGACPSCTGLGVVQRCDPDRLITHPERDLAEGAMAGTKPGAYFGEADGQFIATLRAAAQRAGVVVTGPFASLRPEARRLALEGTGDTSYAVTWEYKRGKRAGVHTFSGPWLGLCALVEREARQRAGRKNAAEWAAPLAPLTCPQCQGERLAPAARRVTVDGLRLPELSRRSLGEVRVRLAAMDLPAVDRPVFEALRVRLDQVLAGLCALGLGHLGLDRPSRTLSSGERQRLRLAAVLGSELRGVTLALDEPGQGLAEAALVDLSARLRAFCEGGNTVVLVTHRSRLIEAADEVIELGPGAGAAGGRLVYQGPPRPPEAVAIPCPDLRAQGTIHIHGAHAHNLRDIDIELPDQGLVAITGPSGSGKTTFLFEVLGASVAAGAPRGCKAIEGLPTFARTHVTRELTAASPLSALSLLAPLQTLFHGLGSGLPKRAFSFRSPAGRCPACKGTGHERIAMDFMADLRLPCEACQGRRYRPEVLAARFHGMTIADLLEAPVASLAPLLGGKLRVATDALCRLGLGHLGLGRADHLLSGGERQRLLLAVALTQRGPGRELFLLDEPASGLHVDDQRRLAEALHELAAKGALVVYTTHRRAMIDTAHRRLQLGPGGGPEGGRLVNPASSETLGQGPIP